MCGLTKKMVILECPAVGIVRLFKLARKPVFRSQGIVDTKYRYIQIICPMAKVNLQLQCTEI